MQMVRLTMSGAQFFTLLGITLMILSALVSPLVGEAYGDDGDGNLGGPPPAQIGCPTADACNIDWVIVYTCYYNKYTMDCSYPNQPMPTPYPNLPANLCTKSSTNPDPACNTCKCTKLKDSSGVYYCQCQ
jgi:hypothetical protein